MDARSWKWTDAHFCSLPSQTNIYGCSKITGPGMTKKLLVASLVGKFYTIEYQRIFDKLTPATKEIQFTYIPGEAEIVSVDAFTARGLIIGITFWKIEDNESKQFLNIYSASQIGEEFNLESVAQGCQSIELQFVPYILTHAETVIDGQNETVFLLSGSDAKIHLYREINGQHSFKEEGVATYFPELTELNSCVIWMDIVYIDNMRRRVTVCGHHSGIVTLSMVDLNKSEILKTYSVDHDSPISYVKLFSLTNRVPRPSFLQEQSDPGCIKDNMPQPELHLLVLSALLPATVYKNIMTNGVSDSVYLLESNRYDAILCGCIIDMDLDGENEILIGTYGQEILAYKLSSSHKMIRSHTADLSNLDSDNASKPRHRSGETELSSTPGMDQRILSRRVKSQENLSSSVTSERDFMLLSSSKDTVLSERKAIHDSDSCSLVWQRSFAYPVIGMNRLDIMADGMEDLIVVTLKGIHILQPDMNEVASVCLERLRMLADSNCNIHREEDTTEDQETDTCSTGEPASSESLSPNKPASGSLSPPSNWDG